MFGDSDFSEGADEGQWHFYVGVEDEVKSRPRSFIQISLQRENVREGVSPNPKFRGPHISPDSGS